MITVRLATCDDAAGIAHVHVESWRTTYAGILPAEVVAARTVERRAEQWRAVLCNPAGQDFAYVAEQEGGQIVGFASGGPQRDDSVQFPGELYAIYLLQQAQRHDIGRRLVGAVAEHLAENGFHAMTLWVIARNPACRFYERLGGQVVGYRTELMGDTPLEEVAYGWRDTQGLCA